MLLPVLLKLQSNLTVEQQSLLQSEEMVHLLKTLLRPNGTNTITVVATDSAGKSTTVTRTVTLDTAAPVIKSVTLTPNPVDCGKTFVISVEVTD